MISKKEEDLVLLIEASSFILGYLIGKHGLEDPAAAIIASALHKCGVESVWVDSIVGKQCQK